MEARMSLDQILFLFITIVCWSTAAWLFWKWDIGFHRSRFEQRLKERKKTTADKNEKDS